MTRFITFFVVLVASATAYATAYTATSDGLWNSSATWNNAGVPVSGDTATINTGVTVTVPDGYTAAVGPDDGTTVALKCSANTGTGKLIVNGTLQFKGHVQQCDSAWQVNSDGSTTHGRLEHAGSTSSYYWQIGMATNPTNAR